MGQLKFDESTLTDNNPCSLSDEVNLLSRNLSCDMRYCLTMKKRTVGNESTESPLNLKECLQNRDSVAKDLYGRLFNWLVEMLNLTIKPIKDDPHCSNLGLLDIYGFEVFKVNGFEQIMINYTNEKLHQLYIQYVFKEEKNIFIQEGLESKLDNIKFQDNNNVITLIEQGNSCIFSVLNESCAIKQTTDEGFLAKLRSTQKSNPLLKHPKMNTEMTFTIIHTAKDVEYNASQFVGKNKDELNPVALKSL